MLSSFPKPPGTSIAMRGLFSTLLFLLIMLWPFRQRILQSTATNISHLRIDRSAEDIRRTQDLMSPSRQTIYQAVSTICYGSTQTGQQAELDDPCHMHQAGIFQNDEFRFLEDRERIGRRGLLNKVDDLSSNFSFR